MPSAQHKALHETLVQYLEGYAEPEAYIASQLSGLREKHQYCLCIPFYDDSFCDLEMLLRSLSNEKFLLIAVVNQPDSIDQASPANVTYRETIHSHYSLLEERENLALYNVSPGCSLLVVDRFSGQLSVPEKQGVGLARKIAADIAATFIYEKKINSNWIFCSDADAQLPAAYFHAAHSHDPKGCGALVYPYAHRTRQTRNPANVSYNLEKVQRATEIYELCLRQYEEGLHSAGSPYAYQTLGSTLCLSVYYYAIVRGFPKRNAAEDFYILNKMQKVAGVQSLENPTIILESRLSARAPFGTGIAVSNLVRAESMQNEPVFYHPMLFNLLKSLHLWFGKLSVEQVKEESFDWKKSMRMHLLDHLNLTRTEPATHSGTGNSCETVDHAMLKSLEQQGFAVCMEHCKKHCQSHSQLQRHIHEWFDAFRTLKWLHLVRARVDELANLCFAEISRPKQRRGE